MTEAARYQLAKADRERFEAQWTKTLAGRPRSETAGTMAATIRPFVAGNKDYPGRAEHLKQVTDYLRRTTRVKYHLVDMIEVCVLLELLPNERDLYEKLLKRGLKLFPESAFLLSMAGAGAEERAVRGGNPRLARQYLEKAMERAKVSSDPNDAGILAKIQKKPSRLESLASALMHMSFAPGGPFPGFLDAMSQVIDVGDGLFDEDDYDEDDFEDEDDGRPFLPLPAPSRAKASPKPKKKKKKGVIINERPIRGPGGDPPTPTRRRSAGVTWSWSASSRPTGARAVRGHPRGLRRGARPRPSARQPCCSSRARATRSRRSPPTLRARLAAARLPARRPPRAGRGPMTESHDDEALLARFRQWLRRGTRRGRALGAGAVSGPRPMRRTRGRPAIAWSRSSRRSGTS